MVNCSSVLVQCLDRVNYMLVYKTDIVSVCVCARARGGGGEKWLGIGSVFFNGPSYSNVKPLKLNV